LVATALTGIAEDEPDVVDGNKLFSAFESK